MPKINSIPGHISGKLHDQVFLNGKKANFMRNISEGEIWSRELRMRLGSWANKGGKMECLKKKRKGKVQKCTAVADSSRLLQKDFKNRMSDIV